MIVIVFTAIVYVVKLMRDQYESEIICCKSKKKSQNKHRMDIVEPKTYEAFSYNNLTAVNSLNICSKITLKKIKVLKT